MDNNRIAIFIDAENVTNWLKKGGAELLLEELILLCHIRSDVID